MSWSDQFWLLVVFFAPYVILALFLVFLGYVVVRLFR